MRIRVRAGDPAAVPSLWRGAVLERHEADGWRRRLRLRSEHPLSIRWPADGIGSWRRPGVAGAEVLAEVVVDCEDPRQAILFAPLEALGLTVPTGASPDAVYARSDGVFQRRLPPGVRTAGGFRYAVALGADGPAVGAADAETCAPFVRLDRDDTRAVPAVAHDLLRDALRGLGPDPSQAEVVESCRALLAGRFDYRLPGADGAADGLSTFLAGEGGGHCELFATGLALLLRLRGIPCRLATGFLVDEWDAEQRSFVVRNRHAHAWVEVYDAGRQTWHAVDPTPAADGPEPAADGLLAALTAPFRALWRSVTTFDAAARGTLLDAVRHAPGRALAAVRSAPWASLALAAGLLALGAALRRRRRRRAADPVLAYQRLLRELRIRRHPEETPRELLARAAPTLGDRGRIDALERATQAHEAARFGRSAVARS
jgi:hypothetical protein